MTRGFVAPGPYKALLRKAGDVVAGPAGPDGPAGAAGATGPMGLTGASWALTSVRYFILDNENGNDANTGYIDAAAGTNLSATAPAVARKTIAGLLSILPRVGDGRTAVILFKARAVADKRWMQADGVTPDDLRLALSGYSQVIIRSCTDYSNTTADRGGAGTIVSTGPNGDGSWTVAAAAAVGNTVQVAAGALPTDTTLLGRRVRVVSGTRANQASGIYRSIDASNFITQQQNSIFTGGGLQVGDTFWIEKPAVSFANIQIQIAESIVAGSTCAIVGLRSDGFLTVTGAGQINIAFVEAAGITVFRRISVLSLLNSFFDEVSSAVITPGSAFRHESGSCTVQGIDSLSFNHAAMLSTSAASLQFINNINSGASCWFHRAPTITSNFGGKSSGYNSSIAVANTRFGRDPTATATERTWINGIQAAGLRVQANIDLVGIDFNNQGAAACVLVQGNGHNISFNDLVSTSGGNTGVAVDLQSARNCRIVIGQRAACTVSPTGGEVKLADNSTIVTWASLTTSDVLDTGGNHLVGSGGWRYRRIVDGTEDLPELNADPASPPAGYVRRYYRKDLEQFCVKYSDGTVKRSAAFT